ncbi:hypothetical protein JH314_05095 [Xanthomonas campestris]|uniref:hypothetical protein n=1 Tax=Xanthomonas campestris TaxID=339 RepID=UPI0013905739|nr:hypothetical protein [Xanthomonas campestris]MEA9480110.1 hypothetical protein [Xanthomonas campestris]WDJ02834.1 hypothetical protein JH314_05095 [Xanthomonas campestris]WDJ90773.1 hypothetical protein JH302_05320 [Xanthomonas campestris]WVL59930.1 hypothetical protein LLE68_016850 [Xanthomonas campestris pv. barbareae]
MARNTCSLIAAPCSVGDMPSSPSPQLPKDEENSLLRFRSRQPQRVQRPHLSPSAAHSHSLETGFLCAERHGVDANHCLFGCCIFEHTTKRAFRLSNASNLPNQIAMYTLTVWTDDSPQAMIRVRLLLTCVMASHCLVANEQEPLSTFNALPSREFRASNLVHLGPNKTMSTCKHQHAERTSFVAALRSSFD